MILRLFLCIFFALTLSNAQEIDDKLLQCLICRTSIEEVENVLNKIDPVQNIEMGHYRLDDMGNIIRKKVPLKRSQVHISEVLDNICQKMDDYVRAKYKSNGRLTLLKLIGPDGQMNSEMSNVDIIQDGDLNKSLKFHCDDIVQEHEERITELFQKGESNIINKVCTEEGNYCDTMLPPDEEDENERVNERIEL